jgi:AraC-like DNA-binding protein
MSDYTERRTRQPLFACTWSRSTADASGSTRVVPDGCADVLWHQETGRLFVAGPDTRAHVGEQHRGLLVGVRFKPGLAPAGLGVPSSEIRDLRVDLDLLWPGDRVRRLADALAVAASPAAVLADAVAAGGFSWDRSVPGLVAAVRRGERVSEVAASLGLTERQVHRRCLAAFGYGPKVLQRVLRFDAALRMVREGGSLAAVAYSVGYSDQAHFSREVRALAGVSVSALL